MSRTILPEREALAELGITWAEFEAPLAAGPRGPAMLAELQVRAKKRFKELALELHPDRTGGDPVKTEHFKHLAAAMDALDSLQVTPAGHPPASQPGRVVVRQVIIMDGGWSTSTSTSTTTTGGWPAGGWPFR